MRSKRRSPWARKRTRVYVWVGDFEDFMRRGLDAFGDRVPSFTRHLEPWNKTEEGRKRRRARRFRTNDKRAFILQGETYEDCNGQSVV